MVIRVIRVIKDNRVIRVIRVIRFLSNTVLDRVCYIRDCYCDLSIHDNFN